MHKMDSTPKTITIIALILEGLGALGIIVVLIVFSSTDLLQLIYNETALELSTEFSDYHSVFYGFVRITVIFLSISMLIFVVNLILFVPLLKGKCSETKASRIYLYQAIWGGLNLFSNTFVGVLYLVSGVQGRSGHQEMTNIREGI